jgi:curved DNA-binding protein
VPAPKDYYAVLGVAEDAPADEVKKAYRRLAREHHPDRNAGDRAAEDKFKELQEAYDVVGDAEKRKAYDRVRRDPYAGRFSAEGNPFAGFGEAGREGGARFYRAPDGTYVRVDASGAGPEADFIFGGGNGGGLGDIFGDLFGGSAPGGRRRARPEAPPADAEATLQLAFEDALRGGPQTFRIGDDTLRIELPPGVRPGHKVRLRGRGPEGPDGRRGDLYLVVDVRPHPRYRREGDDLVVTETVNAVEAMLGTTREIEPLYGGRIRVQIKPGTQPGERLRLRGQGVRTAEGKGDLYVEVDVRVPGALSEEARAKLEAWAREAGLVEGDG